MRMREAHSGNWVWCSGICSEHFSWSHTAHSSLTGRSISNARSVNTTAKPLRSPRIGLSKWNTNTTHENIFKLSVEWLLISFIHCEWLSFRRQRWNADLFFWFFNFDRVGIIKSIQTIWSSSSSWSSSSRHQYNNVSAGRRQDDCWLVGWLARTLNGGQTNKTD